jgi:hypothetical protein
MNESMLLSLYCFVDDFVMGLEGHIELGHWHGERGPKRRLSLSEIMPLNITCFLVGSMI